jgi:ABC-2 type transport system ATP-binding protein
VTEALAIETIDLRKRYADVEALRGVDLAVPPGSIFGFLGRNGAGKTTTMKILLGMARPTAGTARVFGLDAAVQSTSVVIRGRTAFVSEEKDLYGHMTVGQIVRFTARFYVRWRRDLEQRYLRRFTLPLDRKVKDLSRGMRTKLAMLLALSRGAELLILDEPTSGLDPAMAEDVLQALVAHVADGAATVFFSSHQIAEVDQVADRIAIVDRGRVAVSGGLDDLRSAYQRIELVFDGAAPDPSFRTPEVLRVAKNHRVLTVIVSGRADDVIAEARALQPVSVERSPLTLKDVFLETVGVVSGSEP